LQALDGGHALHFEQFVDCVHRCVADALEECDASGCDLPESLTSLHTALSAVYESNTTRAGDPDEAVPEEEGSPWAAHERSMTVEEWALSSPSVSCAMGDSLVSEEDRTEGTSSRAHEPPEEGTEPPVPQGWKKSLLQAHMNASSAECESPSLSSRDPRGDAVSPSSAVSDAATESSMMSGTVSGAVSGTVSGTTGGRRKKGSIPPKSLPPPRGLVLREQRVERG